MMAMLATGGGVCSFMVSGEWPSVRNGWRVTEN